MSQRATRLSSSSCMRRGVDRGFRHLTPNLSLKCLATVLGSTWFTRLAFMMSVMCTSSLPRAFFTSFFLLESSDRKLTAVSFGFAPRVSLPPRRNVDPPSARRTVVRSGPASPRPRREALSFACTSVGVHFLLRLNARSSSWGVMCGAIAGGTPREVARVVGAAAVSESA